MTPRPQPEPLLEHVRTLWVMARPSNKAITAAIFRTASGSELRVMVGTDVANTIDSLLSRTGDAPLEARAAELRGVLEAQGWTETLR